MKTTNAKHIIVAALCVASFATADVVDTIFAKAKEAEDDGGVNFCGFYVGMSKADAETLVSHYRLKNGEFLIEGDPVYSINFSIKGVQRITKGGNSYDELCQAVAKRVGWMESKSDAGIFEDWDDLSWEEYNTIDGVRVTMSKSVHGCGKVGFTMFDVAATKAAELKAREEREAAERKAMEAAKEKAKQFALSWKLETKKIAISDSVSIELTSVPGPLWFGKTEVSQAEWEAVMGSPCQIEIEFLGQDISHHWRGPDLPAVCVSWNECQLFLKRLNAIPAVKDAGIVFRLPNSREWENACRAGSTGSYCLVSDGTEITEKTLDEVAWYKPWYKNYGDVSLQPVGQKKPNAFGLYDMHGSVWELTQDGKADERIVMGGAYIEPAGNCECSSFDVVRIEKPKYYWIGFRLCADGFDKDCRSHEDAGQKGPPVLVVSSSDTSEDSLSSVSANVGHEENVRFSANGSDAEQSDFGVL